jgi:hypothetical protein
MPYVCITRTRQASQRCSNVRVVLFYDYANTEHSAQAEILPWHLKIEFFSDHIPPFSI